VFVAAALVATFATQVVINAWLWAQREDPVMGGSTSTPPTIPAQTAKDLGPIFRCSGAGAEVLVFLGQDSSTLTWSCTKVKP
jgi:hypothetical protein